MSRQIKRKKNGSSVSGLQRGGEKIDNALRSLDRVMLGFITAVIICVLIGRCGEFDLGRDNNYGFALWFLLIPACLILEVLNFIGWLSGFSWHFNGWEAEMLGLCNVLLIGGIWLWMRRWGRGHGVGFIRMIRTLMMIILVWGIFQIGCCAASWLWDCGVFSPFNRRL